MTIALKGGYTTEDRRLDRIPTWDNRSENWPITAALTKEEISSPRSYTWGLDVRLNQGVEGRCVEYGINHELRAKPRQVAMAKVEDILANRSIYWPAQERDEWPGGSYPGAVPFYEGTSVHAGMAVATELGFYKEYRWAMTIDDFIVAIGHKGPGVIGVDFYDGMYDPDENGLIYPTGAMVGGHCMCVNSVDLKRERFGLPNSWGYDWGVADRYGIGGYCYIKFADMEKLLKDAGEFCIPIARHL